MINKSRDRVRLQTPKSDRHGPDLGYLLYFTYSVVAVFLTTPALFASLQATISISYMSLGILRNK